MAMALAARLAATAWHAWQPLADPASFLRYWPLLFALPVGLAFLGLYPAAGVNPVEEIRRIALFVTAMFASVSAALFLTGDLSGTSRGNFLLGWLFIVAAIPIGRAMVRATCARRTWWGLPAILLGGGKTGELLVRQLDEHLDLDLKILGCLDDDPRKQNTSVGRVPVLGTLSGVAALQRSSGASYGIVAMPGLGSERLAEVVRDYGDVFPHLIVVPNAFGLSSVGVGTRDLGGFVGLYNKQNLLLHHNLVLKRVLDLLLLVPALVVAVPVVALCALAVTLVSPGNPFFAQRREGKSGEPLRVWKLRTMRRDADAYLEAYLARKPEARTEWERYYKLTHDPRVLPVVGPFLRRSSLDELPQLLNILLGQMSFVGPRPFPYYHVEQFDADFRRLRTKVPPGLTGYWQVTSRSSADLAAQKQLDGYYIRNWSLWMDVYLLFRTPLAVVFGKGAY